MLFRYSVELADKYMPESYIKLTVSQYHYPSLPNGTELNFLLPPQQCWDDDLGRTDKTAYFAYLSGTPECMASIITIMQALQNNHDVAILTSDEEVQFGFARYICEFITERYGYTSFPFKSMDDISLDMRRLSCITPEGEQTLIDDMCRFG